VTLAGVLPTLARPRVTLAAARPTLSRPRATLAASLATLARAPPSLLLSLFTLSGARAPLEPPRDADKLARVWLFLLLLGLPLLVSKDKLDAIVDPNDPEAVTEWFVETLTARYGYADAWDIVQAASELCLPKGGRPWNRRGKITFATHFNYVATDWRHNETRRMGHAVLPDRRDDDPLANRAEGHDTETLAYMSERWKRIRDATLANFARSPSVLPMVHRMLAGEWARNEAHAKATGLSVAQVEDAKAQVLAFCEEWAERYDRETPRRP
jgi:hypothetical protein